MLTYTLIVRSGIAPQFNWCCYERNMYIYNFVYKKCNEVHIYL